MELYIRLKNGQPFEHPILGDNFKQAFPWVDINNLPSEFARFKRVPEPVLGVYEVLEGCSYQFIGDVVEDVWSVREMTEAERTAKNEQLIKEAYKTRDYFKAVAEYELTQATLGTVKEVWRAYIAELENYVASDPIHPKVPSPPRFDSEGNVLTTDASGSSPDVTG